MKKLFLMLISAVLAISLSSCGLIFIDDSKEQKAYTATIDSLLTALDSKDEDAIYNLFSPAVREQDEDIKEQINKLLSVYEGPADEHGWDGILAGGAAYENGKRSKNAYGTFPIRSGNTYYWCYLKIVYEDTFDETQIGISQLDFHTADEYCIFRYDDTAKFSDTAGLTVYAERVLEEEVRCIHGDPHKYFPSDTLKLDEVKAFLKAQNSFSAFKAQFGEPNAEHIYTYYELPREAEMPRYLQLSIHEGTIIYASIVDNYLFIETVYTAPEE